MIKCEICYPRGLMKKHFISEKGNVNFYYDMCNRAAIIASPKEHMNVLQSSPEFIGLFMNNIITFCSDWGIDNYKLVYCNKPSSKKHTHLKIYISKEKLDYMRNIHFEVLKRSKLYS